MSRVDLLPVLERAGMLNPVPWWGAEIIEVAEPSRVAFAGCWHARHDLARAALEAAADAGATVVVHTGDLLFTGVEADRMAFLVDAICEDLGLTVVAVRGNHDDPALYRKAATNTRRRKPVDGFARVTDRILHAPNGMRWTWQGVEFVALGGAFSVDRAALVEGESYWKGEVASVRDVTTVKRRGQAQVMVTHDIPTGVRLPVRGPHPDWWDLDGAAKHHDRLRSAVDAVRPDWVVGGHMHLRHTDGLWLDGGHQVRVEVLDKIEAGVPGNLLVADLIDGQMTPAPVEDAVGAK